MLVLSLTLESPTEPSKERAFPACFPTENLKPGSLQRICVRPVKAVPKNESIRYFLLSTFPVLASMKAT
jgi:hypothetical protein